MACLGGKMSVRTLCLVFRFCKPGRGRATGNYSQRSAQVRGGVNDIVAVVVGGGGCRAAGWRRTPRTLAGDALRSVSPYLPALLGMFICLPLSGTVICRPPGGRWLETQG